VYTSDALRTNTLAHTSEEELMGLVGDDEQLKGKVRRLLEIREEKEKRRLATKQELARLRKEQDILQTLVKEKEMELYGSF
jgi:hypothetical protein